MANEPCIRITERQRAATEAAVADVCYVATVTAFVVVGRIQ